MKRYYGFLIVLTLVLTAQISMADNSIGTNPTSKLIQDLSSPNALTQFEAIRELAHRKEQTAVPLLIQLTDIKRPKDTISRTAITALGEIGGNQAFTALSKILNDQARNQDERGDAAASLGQLQDPSVVTILITVLNQKNVADSIKARILHALGNYNQKESIKALVQFVKPETNQLLLMPTIVSLSKLQAKEAVPSLIVTLNSTDSDLIKNAIITALGTIGDLHAIPALIEFLKKTQLAELKSNVLLVFAKFKSPQTTLSIIPLLKDPNPNVKLYAIFALNKIGDTKAVEPLKNLYSEHVPFPINTDVKQAFLDQINEKTLIIQALNNIFPSSGIQLFKEAAMPLKLKAELAQEIQIQNAVMQLRQVALEGLINTQDSSAVSFVQQENLLKDSSVEIRATAVKVLGIYNNANTIQNLITALRDASPKVRWTAAWALGRSTNDKALQPLIAALDDPHPEVVIQSIYSLARYSNPTAKQAIASVLAKNTNETVKKVAQSQI